MLNFILDVTVAPGNLITYRTIGGILDYFVFMGPTPENVIQQYTSVCMYTHKTKQTIFCRPIVYPNKMQCAVWKLSILLALNLNGPGYIRTESSPVQK